MDELDTLRGIADKQKKDKAKIEGKIESLMEDLKEEGFGSVVEASAAMDALGGRITEMHKIRKRKIEFFRKKYADELA